MEYVLENYCGGHPYTFIILVTEPVLGYYMITDHTNFRNVEITKSFMKCLEIIWQQQLLDWVNVSYVQTFNIWTARMIMHQYGGETPWASHTPELL